jgi:hypothetical protein
VAVAAALALAGCGGAPPPEPAPPLDAGGTASGTRVATRLQDPARILFDWSSRERDARFSGRGVARVEPPYRARLDLFLGNGETVARAALVDDDLRIPPSIPSEILPPRHLLWSALGVFRPGSGSALLGGEAQDDGTTLLRYGFVGGEELRYRLRGRRIQEVELLREGTVVERLELGWDETGSFPAEAVYRDLVGFVELRLTRTSVDRVERYPPDIWTPGVATAGGGP